MSAPTPRLRMFAGPNGSGKSTLKDYLPVSLLGIYLNNISRVRNRVSLGGHSVPEDRITSRYHRSLGLLMEAIQHSNRAYVFDNSGDNADRKHTWLAEITEGRVLELKTERIPAWFKRAVLDKIS